MSQPEPPVQGQMAAALRQAAPSERRQIMLDGLSSYVGHILDNEPGDAVALQRDDRIFDLGLSSLVITELKTWLDEEFSTELPLTLFFTHVDLGSLIDHVLDQIVEQPAQAIVVNEPEDAEAALLRKIADVEGKYGL